MVVRKKIKYTVGIYFRSFCLKKSLLVKVENFIIVSLFWCLKDPGIQRGLGRGKNQSEGAPWALLQWWVHFWGLDLFCKHCRAFYLCLGTRQHMIIFVTVTFDSGIFVEMNCCFSLCTCKLFSNSPSGIPFEGGIRALCWKVNLC